MVSQIFQLHNTTLAFNQVYYSLSYPSLVKPILAMSNYFPECFSKGWELDYLSGQWRFPVEEHLVPIWRSTLEKRLRHILVVEDVLEPNVRTSDLCHYKAWSLLLEGKLPLNK